MNVYRRNGYKKTRIARSNIVVNLENLGKKQKMYENEQVTFFSRFSLLKMTLICFGSIIQEFFGEKS